MTTELFNNLMSGISTQPLVVKPVGVTVKPVELALPLLDYQQEALEHVLRDPDKPYSYIALDMGMGKTPVALATVASLSAAGVKPTLVVVPPSLRVSWRREAAKFAPWLRIATITGSKPQPGDALPDGIDALIIGDSAVAGWADFLTGKVEALVVDEAHRFKNRSNRSAALEQIATGKKMDPVTKRRVPVTTNTPKYRVLMSGTPTPNGRHVELATQVDVLGDGAWKDLGGKGMFWHRYAPKVDAWGGRGNSHGEELHEAMTGSWFFRRLRGLVKDLPNKGRAALHLEGQGRAVKDYIKAEDDLIAYLADKQDGKVSMGQIRAQALIKLLALRHLAGRAKVKSIVEHVKELLDNSDDGVFIVAEHSDVIEDIMIGLGKYNPTTVRGGMSDAEKAWNIDQFTSGESRVLVGQITAAGVGLTLHGDGRNHHVVIAQLPWTPAELTQAEDRLHRIGQTKDVTVEVALCAIDGRWTVDERLWNMLESKCFRSTTLTDGEGQFLLSEAQEGLLDSYRS